MNVKTGDIVTLKDGNRERTLVVIGFTKHHANLATLENYKSSLEKFGEYRSISYGYKSWNLKSSAVQKGFWELLHAVNGLAGTKYDK